MMRVKCPGLKNCRLLGLTIEVHSRLGHNLTPKPKKYVFLSFSRWNVRRYH